MMLSELIKELVDELSRLGDLPVHVFTDEEHAPSICFKADDSDEIIGITITDADTFSAFQE